MGEYLVRGAVVRLEGVPLLLLGRRARRWDVQPDLGRRPLRKRLDVHVAREVLDLVGALIGLVRYLAKDKVGRRDDQSTHWSNDKVNYKVNYKANHLIRDPEPQQGLPGPHRLDPRALLFHVREVVVERRLLLPGGEPRGGLARGELGPHVRQEQHLGPQRLVPPRVLVPELAGDEAEPGENRSDLSAKSPSEGIGDYLGAVSPRIRALRGLTSNTSKCTMGNMRASVGRCIPVPPPT
jgi:hypothetical protein